MRPHYSIIETMNAEPVEFRDLLSHVRIDSDEDIAYLIDIGKVAREYIDSVTGRMSGATTWLLTGESWCDLSQGRRDRYERWIGQIPIHRSPLISVTSVKYYAPHATALTTMATTEYRVILSSEPGMIHIFGALPGVDCRPDAIQIEFQAGGCGLSEMHKHAIKMLAAHLYENRSPVAGVELKDVPYTVRELISNLKVGGMC